MIPLLFLGAAADICFYPASFYAVGKLLDEGSWWSQSAAAALTIIVVCKVALLMTFLRRAVTDRRFPHLDSDDIMEIADAIYETPAMQMMVEIGGMVIFGVVGAFMLVRDRSLVPAGFLLLLQGVVSRVLSAVADGCE